jgi:hypothetical protein
MVIVEAVLVGPRAGDTSLRQKLVEGLLYHFGRVPPVIPQLSC